MKQALVTIGILTAALSGAAVPYPAHAAQKPLTLRASTLLGHDDNATLNAERKGDFFAQQSLSAKYRHALFKSVSAFLAYDLNNSSYFEVTDANVLLQSATAGVQWLPRPRTLLEAEYQFSSFYFPRNDSITSLEHEARVGFRQRLAKDVVWKAGIGTLDKEFDERKLRQADGVLGDGEREDGRLVVDNEIGFKLFEKTYWKLGAVALWNDSNDQFHDYYDYDAIRGYVNASWQPAPKVSSFVKLSYERREYDSRPLVDDAATFQEDDVYTATAALFYKLGKGVSLGAIHTYREKNSNEPSQGYSGSISSLGLYYSF
jgi:hypothetical protein